ncbi:hypothetical protein Tco_1116877 [Tanacetum coccineum]
MFPSKINIYRSFKKKRDSPDFSGKYMGRDSSSGLNSAVTSQANDLDRNRRTATKHGLLNAFKKLAANGRNRFFVDEDADENIANGRIREAREMIRTYKYKLLQEEGEINDKKGANGYLNDAPGKFVDSLKKARSLVYQMMDNVKVRFLEEHCDGRVVGNDTIEDNADVNPSTKRHFGSLIIPEVANGSSIVSPSTPPGMI